MLKPCDMQLSERLPDGTQGHFRSIQTDEHLRVLGSNGEPPPPLHETSPHPPSLLVK